jgi:hypothetical protein
MQATVETHNRHLPWPRPRRLESSRGGATDGLDFRDGSNDENDENDENGENDENVAFLIK